MKYRFMRMWAGMLEAVGIVILACAVIAALVVWIVPLPPPVGSRVHPVLARAAAMLALLTGGALLGGPCIVLGQLLHVWLDQRRVLVRIQASLRGLVSRERAERPVDDVLRRR